MTQALSQLNETALEQARDAGAQIYQIQTQPPKPGAGYTLVYQAYNGCSSGNDHERLNELMRQGINVVWVNTNIDGSPVNPRPPGKEVSPPQGMTGYEYIRNVGIGFQYSYALFDPHNKKISLIENGRSIVNDVMTAIAEDKKQYTQRKSHSL